jgi:hypothetical protein
VERNRAAQRQRNAARRAGLAAADASTIAKGDAWTGEAPLPSGTYRLERRSGAGDRERGRVNAQNLLVISALGPFEGWRRRGRFGRGQALRVRNPASGAPPQGTSTLCLHAQPERNCIHLLDFDFFQKTPDRPEAKQ